MRSEFSLIGDLERHKFKELIKGQLNALAWNNLKRQVVPFCCTVIVVTSSLWSARAEVACTLGVSTTLIFRDPKVNDQQG